MYKAVVTFNNASEPKVTVHSESEIYNMQVSDADKQVVFSHPLIKEFVNIQATMSEPFDDEMAIFATASGGGSACVQVIDTNRQAANFYKFSVTIDI